MKKNAMRIMQTWRTVHGTGASALALIRPFFASEHKVRAWSLLAAIVALNLGLVWLAVWFNEWNRLFYDALQERNAQEFWKQLGRFAALAGVFILAAVYKFYLTQVLELRWRAWMTRHYLDRWLSHQAYYRLELRRFVGAAPDAPGPDNPDQRMQEDIQQFTGYTLSLSMGLLHAVVTLASFVGILWTLSGSFNFDVAGVSVVVPGFMVWLAVLYCAAGSYLTHRIGKPQIRLNFLQQRREADFRHHLVRVREASEAIALDRGESAELAGLQGRFDRVLDNTWALIRAQKNLIWFTSFFGQAAVVFPFLVASGRFLSGAIQLGTLMQIASAFGQVQGALSWFVEQYTGIAAWKATTDRLTGFDDALRAARLQANEGELVVAEAEELRMEDVRIDLLRMDLPPGVPIDAPAAVVTLDDAHRHGVLLDGLHWHIPAGRAVLLRGASGMGKSTLFRAIAGIWPYGSGRIERPGDAVFLPQKPYIPVGTLRDALCYPEARRIDDDALREALRQVGLEALGDRLDEHAAWGQTLSGGEVQRLAIARVLLRPARWVFADEASSALDAVAEEQAYRALLRHVRGCGGTVVSVGHKPTLAALHDECWELRAEAPVLRRCTPAA